MTENPSLFIEEIRDPKDGSLLHLVVRLTERKLPDFEVIRVDISDPKEFLQAALIWAPPRTTFAPHIHKERNKNFTNLRAQESWVILEGEVEVTFFDEQGAELEKKTLKRHDASFSFRGGHGYKALQGGALVYEFKSGPYEGQIIDKFFI